MKITAELIGILIWKRWVITFNEQEKCYQFRSPDGLSGWTYMTKNFETFPPSVREWILDNVPMTVSH